MNKESEKSEDEKLSEKMSQSESAGSENLDVVIDELPLNKIDSYLSAKQTI